MTWKSSSDRYGRVAIIIHWVSAAAILGLFALGFAAANASDPALKAALLRGHVPLGIAAVVLTLLRIVWWLVDRRPAPPSGLPKWQKASETAVRRLLYAVVILMGLSGIGLLAISGAGAILFFGAPGDLPNLWDYPPMFAHYLGALALLCLAGLHIVAAMYHQLWKKDRLLARMGVGSR